jgi:hypothetical protein
MPQRETSLRDLAELPDRLRRTTVFLDPYGADVEHQLFQRLLEADRAEQRSR